MSKNMLDSHVSVAAGFPFEILLLFVDREQRSKVLKRRVVVVVVVVGIELHYD